MTLGLKRKTAYQKSLKKHGIGPKALQWSSNEAAELRYKQLICDLEFEGKSVLDVGCGFGDLVPFIKSKAKKFDYLGVDIVDEFIKEARSKYPGQDFMVHDYFGKPLDKEFDLVLASGVLNFSSKDPVEFRRSAIKLLFKSAKDALAFNMAGAFPQPKNKKKLRVYYADSLGILKYCLSLSSKVIFRHHYHPKDFTIVMYK